MSKKDMDELFDTVKYDGDLPFIPKPFEEDDGEDDEDTFDEVIESAFPWLKE